MATCRKEERARLKVAAQVIEHIEERYTLGLSDAVLNQIKTKYEIRIQRIRKDQSEEKLTRQQIEEFTRIQLALIRHERDFVLGLRKAGQIKDEVLRKIEYELDLEEARLELELQTSE